MADNRTEEQRVIQNAILLACVVSHMLNGPTNETIEEPLAPEIDLYRSMLVDQMEQWLVPAKWQPHLERALTVWHRGWRDRPLGP